MFMFNSVLISKSTDLWRKCLPTYPLYLKLFSFSFTRSLVFFLSVCGFILWQHQPFAFSAGTNSITVFNQSSSHLSNHPISVAKVFQQGDIPQFASAQGSSVIGITQCDVKNRWPDGSLKFAVVSFLVNILDSDSIEVSFVNQPTGNNSGYLTKNDMLDASFAFDAKINISGNINTSASARELLSQDRFMYWLQGPIVTAIILQDNDPSLPYDHGIGAYPLHPLFESWFYPDLHKIMVGYTMENCWASSDPALSAQSISYNVTLTEGLSDNVVFTHPTFNHIERTRWHKRFWVGGTPPATHVRHDPVYLIDTKAVPNFDTSLTLAQSLTENQYSSWLSDDKTFDGDSSGIGAFPWDIDGGGAADYIGLLPTWDVLWVLTQDTRMIERSLGNADLGGRLLFHWRERDSMAGSGNYFDAKDGATSGSINTFGRILSLNARKSLRLSELDWNDTPSENRIQVNGLDNGEWQSRYVNGMDTSHMPEVAYAPYLISGQHYYLEELQMQATHSVALYTRGVYVDGGYIEGGQIRGVGWAWRTLGYAAFISPDDSAEQSYFNDKLKNNIAFWEGRNNLTLTDTSRQSHYNKGQNSQQSYGVSPLGVLNVDIYAQPPASMTGVQYATSLWMENFVAVAWGLSRDFGYATDTLLKYIALNRFNLLLNPLVDSPALTEGYRFAGTLTSTNGWMQSWSEVNSHHDIQTWTDENNLNTDHSYGYISLSALSFLYPYSIIANGTTESISATGQEVWDTLFGATARVSGKVWRRPNVLENNSPKWSLLPREISPQNPTPARPVRLRIQ